MKAATGKAAELDFCLDDVEKFALPKLHHACIDLVEAILRQPGGRELLDAETARRKACIARGEPW